MKIYVVLHNIRSAHNVGSLFRTADGAGVTTIYLCGYTPMPTDRFGREVKEMAKTSLGATHSVHFEYGEDTYACIDRLKKEGVRIIAVEQHDRAIPYTEAQHDSDVAFIFGNEIEGVPEDICTSAHEVIHIPMHGTKESLNVGVSAGIVLFDARERTLPSTRSHSQRDQPHP